MNTSEIEKINRDALTYRKERFAVEVKPSRHPAEEGEITLSTTTNGHQWTSISFLRSEAEKVIKALTEAIR